LIVFHTFDYNVDIVVFSEAEYDFSLGVITAISVAVIDIL
jgi:hypothetical protein